MFFQYRRGSIVNTYLRRSSGENNFPQITLVNLYSNEIPIYCDLKWAHTAFLFAQLNFGAWTNPRVPPMFEWSPNFNCAKLGAAWAYFGINITKVCAKTLCRYCKIVPVNDRKKIVWRNLFGLCFTHTERIFWLINSWKNRSSS